MPAVMTSNGSWTYVDEASFGRRMAEEIGHIEALARRADTESNRRLAQVWIDQAERALATSPVSRPASHAIDRAKRLATDVLEFCRNDLGISRKLKIEWYVGEDRGYVMSNDPATVRVNTRMLTDTQRLIETVAHETYHAGACLAGDPHGDHEAGAKRYGCEVERKWRCS